MSLLNAYVTKDRALILADTAAVFMKTGGLGWSSKLFPIVHANAVIGSIGSCDIGSVLMHMCLRISTFDDICDAMTTERIVQKATEDVEREHAKYDASKLPAQALVIVGYSSRLQECLGMYALRPAADTDFIVRRFTSAFVCPCEPWMNLPFCNGVAGGEPDTPEKLVEVARHQVRAMKEKCPDGNIPGTRMPLAIGGPLTLAEITKDRISVTIGDAS